MLFVSSLWVKIRNVFKDLHDLTQIRDLLLLLYSSTSPDLNYLIPLVTLYFPTSCYSTLQWLSFHLISPKSLNIYLVHNNLTHFSPVPKTPLSEARSDHHLNFHIDSLVSFFLKISLKIYLWNYTGVNIHFPLKYLSYHLIM